MVEVATRSYNHLSVIPAGGGFYIDAWASKYLVCCVVLYCGQNAIAKKE